jgi:hypothetical protein
VPPKEREHIRGVLRRRVSYGNPVDDAFATKNPVLDAAGDLAENEACGGAWGGQSRDPDQPVVEGYEGAGVYWTEGQQAWYEYGAAGAEDPNGAWPWGYDYEPGPGVEGEEGAAADYYW